MLTNLVGNNLFESRGWRTSPGLRSTNAVANDLYSTRAVTPKSRAARTSRGVTVISPAALSSQIVLVAAMKRRHRGQLLAQTRDDGTRPPDGRCRRHLATPHQHRRITVFKALAHPSLAPAALNFRQPGRHQSPSTDAAASLGLAASTTTSMILTTTRKALHQKRHLSFSPHSLVV